MSKFEKLKTLATAFCMHNIDENLENVENLLDIYDDLKSNGALSEWYPFKKMVIDLLESSGLMPYVAENMEDLSYTDIIRLMPYEMEDGMFFHHGQIQVLDKLLDDKTSSLAIIAPTSFGKTKLVDFYIAKKKPKKTIIIQPTIALLQETFFRLKEKFSPVGYHICMDQEHFDPTVEKWIAIWTQERCLEWLQEYPKNDLVIDLFVIDEFYLIDPKRNMTDDEKEIDDERAEILRYVYKQIKILATKTLLLGPVADEITTTELERLKIDYTPVRQKLLNEYEKWPASLKVAELNQFKLDRLIEIIDACDKGLLIFRPSPNSAQELAKNILEKDFKKGSELSDAVTKITTWLKENYADSVEDWTVYKALNRGIGIHHGRMPRSLQKIILWLFNEGHLHSLIMTPTITQGVNTIAKSLVYWKNPQEGQRSVDYFAYKNIIGRAGRLGCHITGMVYLFDPPPEIKKITIDVPETEENEEIEEEFIDENSSVESSPSTNHNLLKKFRPYFPGLRSERLDKAVEIVNSYSDSFANLSFRDLFKAENKEFSTELLNFCGLGNAKDHFRYNSIVSAFKTKTTSDFITSYKGSDTDRAYYSFFDILNNMQFQFPKGVGLLLKVANHHNLIDSGKYEKLLKEALFRSRFKTHATVYALEEQGIPFHISQKLLSSKVNSVKELFESFKDPTTMEVKKALLSNAVRQNNILTEADIFILDTTLRLPELI